MKHLPKILLTISVLGFLASLTPAGSAIYYGMVKPVSAILFIVFYILHVLQKEVAQYDQEQRATIGLVRPGRTPATVAAPVKSYGNSAVAAIH